MSITLSWDLFVIVFFAIVITYSLIMGKEQSMKIIISTYIAIVAAQGLSNLLERMSGESQPFLQLLGLSLDVTLLSSFKLILFVVAIVILAVRGGFSMDYEESGSIIDTVLTAVFGFVTAGLMLSTLIAFVADVPILDEGIVQNAAIVNIMQDSELMSTMVVNQDLWFSLPAIIVVVIGFLHSEAEE